MKQFISIIMASGLFFAFIIGVAYCDNEMLCWASGVMTTVDFAHFYEATGYIQLIVIALGWPTFYAAMLNVLDLDK